ncbi:MAG: hypothetical protein IKU25_08870 [Clostridia bacterium]|nr:hypothetical protein [Clostridia bacterium]
MREIDIEKWERKVHYECFSQYDRPTFSVAVRLDVTKLVEYTRSTGTSYFTNFLYIASRCLNDITEFRLRILDGKVVEYDKISPSFIVMNNDNVIVTCYSELSECYQDFYKHTRENIEKAQIPEKRESFNTVVTKNDVFFVSCLPWIDFVAASNPYNNRDEFATSIPRLLWGKYVREGDRYVMTMDISVHHALMDGYHVSKGFMDIQKALDNVEDFLGK